MDAATSYVSLFASTNLRASTVQNHLLNFLSSHKIPKTCLVDFGSEFRAGLDKFLSTYGIELRLSRPYNKNSTSQAETHIRLVKSALRQFCLADPQHWTEMLPLVSSALNQATMYGSTITREMLYFSPYSFNDNISVVANLLPECVFNDQFKMLKSLSDRRKQRLLKSSLVDPTNFVKGCLVFASNIPQTSKGGSQELAPPLKGIYRVIEVDPTHLRLAEVFTGAERTLPRELCERISLSDLALLRVNLKAVQMSRIAKKMVNNNRFIPPNKKNTLLSLLDLQPEVPPLTSPDNLTGVTATPSTSDASKKGNDLPDHEQNLLPSHEQAKTPEPDNPQPNLRRRTRSGRAYFCHSASPPPATAGDPRVQKRVRFKQSVELCKEGKRYKIQLNDLYKKTATIRVMLHMVALDFSKQEMFFKTTDIKPNLLHMTYDNKDY